MSLVVLVKEGTREASGSRFALPREPPTQAAMVMSSVGRFGVVGCLGC